MLSYGKKLGYSPIDIKIGTIRKPTLGEIDRLGFETFEYYEGLLLLTPTLYEENRKQLGISQEEALAGATLYDIIRHDELLRAHYTKLLNFFFVEDVAFLDGFFFILSERANAAGADGQKELSAKGYISDENFQTVLSIIAETCYIQSVAEEAEEEPKFKNEEAKRLYEKMKKAREEGKLKKQNDINFTIPNIISAVSNRHPSLNYTNIYSLTVYQLMDSFNRLQTNTLYDIGKTTIAVWGDEKKNFDFSLWYKNEIDKT